MRNSYNVLIFTKSIRADHVYNYIYQVMLTEIHYSGHFLLYLIYITRRNVPRRHKRVYVLPCKHRN